MERIAVTGIGATVGGEIVAAGIDGFNKAFCVN